MQLTRVLLYKHLPQRCHSGTVIYKCVTAKSRRQGEWEAAEKRESQAGHGAHLQGSANILQQLGSRRLLLSIPLKQVVLPGPPDDLQKQEDQSCSEPCSPRVQQWSHSEGGAETTMCPNQCGTIEHQHCPPSPICPASLRSTENFQVPKEQASGTPASWRARDRAGLPSIKHL
jgi:hypothetical protein